MGGRGTQNVHLAESAYPKEAMLSHKGSIQDSTLRRQRKAGSERNGEKCDEKRSSRSMGSDDPFLGYICTTEIRTVNRMA